MLILLNVIIVGGFAILLVWALVNFFLFCFFFPSDCYCCKLWCFSLTRFVLGRFFSNSIFHFALLKNNLLNIKTKTYI